jgi:hypothetical protein
MFRMTVEYAKKAVSGEGKREVELRHSSVLLRKVATDEQGHKKFRLHMRRSYTTCRRNE